MNINCKRTTEKRIISSLDPASCTHLYAPTYSLLLVLWPQWSAVRAHIPYVGRALSGQHKRYGFSPLSYSWASFARVVSFGPSSHQSSMQSKKVVRVYDVAFLYYLWYLLSSEMFPLNGNYRHSHGDDHDVSQWPTN